MAAVAVGFWNRLCGWRSPVVTDVLIDDHGL